MKNLITLAAALIILAALSACGSEPASGAPSASVIAAPPSSSVTVAPGILKDGTYQYKGGNDGEGYHVEGTMVVNNGSIQTMEWKIIDSTGRVFDETYEEVYKGNDTYIQ